MDLYVHVNIGTGEAISNWMEWTDTESLRHTGPSGYGKYDAATTSLKVVKKKERPPKIDKNEVQRLHTEGFTDTEMAKKLGFTPMATARTRLELGLKPNKTRNRRTSPYVGRQRKHA